MLSIVSTKVVSNDTLLEVATETKKNCYGGPSASAQTEHASRDVGTSGEAHATDARTAAVASSMMGALEEAGKEETRRRRELLALQRDLRAARAEGAARAHEAHVGRVASQVREQASNKKLWDQLEGIEPADQAAMHRFSEVCNLRISEQQEDPSAAHSWLALFRRIDANDSGQIDFDEFITLVRSYLALSEGALSSPELKSIWLALDIDRSGHISMGEFGRAMRVGATVHQEGDAGTWRERAWAKNRAHADEQRQERARRFNRGVAAGASAASAEELRHLSKRLNARLARLCEQAGGDLTGGSAGGPARRQLDPAQRHASWYALFKQIDADGSGQIDFAELKTLVREGLALPASSVPEGDIRRLWVALDKDSSGLVRARSGRPSLVCVCAPHACVPCARLPTQRPSPPLSHLVASHAPARTACAVHGCRILCGALARRADLRRRVWAIYETERRSADHTRSAAGSSQRERPRHRRIDACQAEARKAERGRGSPA